MHVSAIVPSYRAGRASVSAKVTILDQAQAAVGGAAVAVTITRPDGSQVLQTRNTNTSGAASFSITSVGPGTYTFAVTNVAKTGLTYDPAANTETSDSIIVG